MAFPMIPPTVYTLIIRSGPGGSISPSPGYYKEGEVVSITATPDAGYEFSHWLEDDYIYSTDISTSVLMDRNKALIAVFSKLPLPEEVPPEVPPVEVLAQPLGIPIEFIVVAGVLIAIVIGGVIWYLTTRESET